MSSSQLPSYDHSKGIQFTEPPHSGWKFGQKIDSTPDGKEWVEKGKDGFKIIETANENPM